MEKKHIILFLCAFLIIIIPFLINNKEVTGTDDSASAEIQKSGYTPWFGSVWEPQGYWMESFLFAVQAAVGLIIIALFVGYYRRKQNS